MKRNEKVCLALGAALLAAAAAALFALFYRIAISGFLGQIMPAFTHKSLTYGLEQTDCCRAASRRPHASLR